MNLKLLFILLVTIVFSACSFKPPANQWEINSANAYNNYTKNFLMQNIELANSDLKSSIKYAKQSANFEQLARIYLGKCALNISVGINDKCEEYKEVKDLINSLELEVYYLMLQNSLKQSDIELLPKEYKEFFKNRFEKNYSLSFESIKKSDKLTSLFLASSLIKNELSKVQIEYLIEKASYYGYKNIILFWLNNLYLIEEKESKKALIKKRVELMSSLK